MIDVDWLVATKGVALRQQVLSLLAEAAAAAAAAYLYIYGPPQQCAGNAFHYDL